MKSFAVLITLVFGAVSASATTRNVPSQYATIQAAINAAANNDTVFVAPGTYTENISFGGKAILVLSSGGRDVTFIEASSQTTPIVSFTSGEGNGSILEGLTVRSVSGSHCIRCSASNPTIRNCVIANSGQDGLNLTNSSPVVTGNTFQNNAQYPVWQDLPSYPRLQGNTYLGNGVQAIGVQGGTLVRVNKTFCADNVPYRLLSSFSFSNNTFGVTPLLTFLPGVTVLCDSGVVISVVAGDGTWSPVQIQAVGTVDSVITFGSWSGASDGWDGLYFSGGAMSSFSRMEYCVVENGGQSGYGQRANVEYAGTGFPTLANCVIRNSSQDGIYIDGSPRITNSTIENNGRFGVLCVAGTPLIGDSVGLSCDLAGNGLYDIYNLSGSDIGARYNFWGQPDSASIAARIYDHEDNGALGRVNFMPFSRKDHDAAAARILKPDSVMFYQTAVAPQALIRNAGLNTDTIQVIFEIGAGGSIGRDSTSIVLVSGDSAVVAFGNWFADTLGTIPTKCFTKLSVDGYLRNDTANSVVAVIVDSTAPIIFGISPYEAGNVGSILATIVGANFQQDATVRLESGDTIIVPESAILTEVLCSDSIQLIIDLTGVNAGLYDLVVTNPGAGHSTFQDAFFVETGREHLWADVIGPSVVRVGRWNMFLIAFGNNGNTDVWGSHILMTLPPRAGYEIRTGDGFSLTGIGSTGDDTTQFAMITVPYLPAGGQGTFQLRTSHDQTTSASIKAGLYASLDQFWEPRWEVFDTTGVPVDLEGGPTKRYHADPNSGGVSRTGEADSAGTPCTPKGMAGPPGTIHMFLIGDVQEFTASVGNGDVGFMNYTAGKDKNPIQVAPIRDIGLPDAREFGGIAPWPGMTEADYAVITQVFERWKQNGDTKLITFNNYDNPEFPRPCNTCSQDSRNPGMPCCMSCVGLWFKVLYEAASILCADPTSSPGPCKWRKEADAKWKGEGKPNVDTQGMLNLAFELHGLKCNPDPHDPDALEKCMKDCMQANTGSKALTISGATKEYSVLRSVDPNGKAGPQGFSNTAHVRADLPLDYLIYFENDSNATLFSDTIWVIDTLSPNLDWSTLNFGQIYPGDGPDSIRPNFKAVSDFNPATGVITWGLYDINLPPDSAPYWGQGWVSYSVRPKPNLPTGTRIENIAAIKFDVNDWILAPMDSVPVFNTIDAGPPTSRVNALADTVPSNAFRVCWTAADDSAGSGIGAVDVYVSENNGPYSLWLSADSVVTCSTYVGNWGSRYAFRSVARDNVGHVEETPPTPDAATVVPSCSCPHQSDISGDGFINVLDVVAVINRVFKGAALVQDPSCPRERADFDANGKVNVLDVIGEINRVFRGGPPPVNPCGP